MPTPFRIETVPILSSGREGRRPEGALLKGRFLRFPMRTGALLLPAALVAVATLRSAVMVTPDPPVPPPDPGPVVVPSPPAGPIGGLPGCFIGEDLIVQDLDIFIEEVQINGLAASFDLVPDSQHHLEYLISVPPGTPPGVGVVRIVFEDGGVLQFYAPFLPPDPPALDL